MKANRANSKTGNFLIELVIVIAFFAVASTVCVQIFVKAHFISVGGRNLTQAVTVAQTAAEGFKAAGGSPEQTARLLDAQTENGGILLYYDKNWQPVGQPGGDGFSLRMEIGGDALKTAQIQVWEGGGDQPIYQMEAAHYAGL